MLKTSQKEKITEYQKEYRKVNKIKLNERGREKYTCFCGSIISNHSKSKHEKSKKHIDFFDEIEDFTEITCKGEDPLKKQIIEDIKKKTYCGEYTYYNNEFNYNDETESDDDNNFTAFVACMF